MITPVELLDAQAKAAISALSGTMVIWDQLKSDPALRLVAAEALVSSLDTFMAISKAVRQSVILHGDGTRLAVVSSAPPGFQ